MKVAHDRTTMTEFYERCRSLTPTPPAPGASDDSDKLAKAVTCAADDTVADEERSEVDHSRVSAAPATIETDAADSGVLASTSATAISDSSSGGRGIQHLSRDPSAVAVGAGVDSLPPPGDNGNAHNRRTWAQAAHRTRGSEGYEFGDMTRYVFSNVVATIWKPQKHVDEPAVSPAPGGSR